MSDIPKNKHGTEAQRPEGVYQEGITEFPLGYPREPEILQRKIRRMIDESPTPVPNLEGQIPPKVRKINEQVLSIDPPTETQSKEELVTHFNDLYLLYIKRHGTFFGRFRWLWCLIKSYPDRDTEFTRKVIVVFRYLFNVLYIIAKTGVVKSND